MDYIALLQAEYFGNLLQDYILGALFLLIGFIFRGWLTGILIRLIGKLFSRSEFKLTYQEYKLHLQKSLNFVLFLVFIFLAFNHLDFPESWDLVPVESFGLRMIMLRLFHLLIAVSLTKVAIKIVVVFGQILIKKADKSESKQDDQLIPFAIEAAKVIIIIFAVLISISTIFELNVGSLVAGLGIGGLAIALAAKESLENLFSSFTIFFDKPFVVGDRVIVGGIEGVVEKVGFRSTRLRTLEKSYLTLPNKKMIDAELDNLTLRTFRRVKFNIGLTYQTKAPIIKLVVEDIRKFLESHPHTNEEVTVKFVEFNSSSLDIMIQYFIDTMDWNLYLQYKEEINYYIMEVVEKHGAQFAYPTQTIHLVKEKEA